MTKKTYFLKAKTEFFTQNALFQGVFKALFDHQNIEKITFCLFKCPLFVHTIGNGGPEVFCGRTHPSEPNTPPKMPFEVTPLDARSSK